ncbi:MAG: Gfo/Idh/MocA family oxidoreductase [Oscillospiraceae bacterium]|nr:Gfo/Idh/MocA family oxidoreductase [Oscillospiraceae bacterium]
MKVGILGAGWIARRVAQTLAQLQHEDIHAAAVASRDLEKAAEFAGEFAIPKAYGSYAELAADPELDLIYIATPHSHHKEHAKLCLKAGKNVLVEKAFTVNAKEARELIALAQAKNLLIAEAIWTRYMPSRFALDKILKSGVIGEPQTLTANLGYDNIHKERMYLPELAGGALLDLGVYPLNFALAAFAKSEIDSIDTRADLFHTGTDLHDYITINFKDGKKAELYASLDEFTDKKGIIRGTYGYIEFENINNCEWIRTHVHGAKTVQFDIPAQITGLEYQFIACKNALAEGKIECPEMPHDEIIRVMEIMDELRARWGVVYPMEQ